MLQYEPSKEHREESETWAASYSRIDKIWKSPD